MILCAGSLQLGQGLILYGWRKKYKNVNDLPVAFDPAEDGDAMVCLDVPEPEVVVLRDGEEEVGVLGMKLELVDALAVPHVVLDAVHRRWVEDAHNASGPRSCLNTCEMYTASNSHVSQTRDYRACQSPHKKMVFTRRSRI